MLLARKQLVVDYDCDQKGAGAVHPEEDSDCCEQPVSCVGDTVFLDVIDDGGDREPKSCEREGFRGVGERVFQRAGKHYEADHNSSLSFRNQ